MPRRRCAPRLRASPSRSPPRCSGGPWREAVVHRGGSRRRRRGGRLRGRRRPRRRNPLGRSPQAGGELCHSRRGARLLPEETDLLLPFGSQRAAAQVDRGRRPRAGRGGREALRHREADGRSSRRDRRAEPQDGGGRPGRGPPHSRGGRGGNRAGADPGPVRGGAGGEEGAAGAPEGGRRPGHRRGGGDRDEVDHRGGSGAAGAGEYRKDPGDRAVTGGALARRYARALLDIGREEGEVRRVLSELERFASLFEETPALRDVLEASHVNRRDKQAVLEAAVAGVGLLPVTTNFLRLLVDKRRMDILPQILAELRRMVEELEGIERVEVVSAAPLPGAQRELLKSVLSKRTGKRIELEERLEPAVLGGMVVKVGSTVYDGSVRTQLSRMRENLQKG